MECLTQQATRLALHASEQAFCRCHLGSLPTPRQGVSSHCLYTTRKHLLYFVAMPARCGRLSFSTFALTFLEFATANNMLSDHVYFN